MTEAPTPAGVLMVGSVPLEATKDVFAKLCTALPDRLHTIPDGETGDRWNYIGWQLSCFPPETRRPDLGGTPFPETGKPVYTLDSVQPTGYDDAAIASYAEFVDLRKQGVIPADVRFQVCLPPPLNSIIGHVKAEVQAEMEPFYEQRFLDSIDNIVKSIPHKDMVIQWDLCFDITALEYDCGRLKESRHKPYFSPVKSGILDRLSRACQHIPGEVNLAFHLCYGDLEHKHFIEPTDTALVVELANDIIQMLSGTHRVEWIHVSVPRNRVDAAYFEPLNELRLNGARFYLGLVHANDEAGTKERISAASAVYKQPFGVATECGLGRTPRGELESILSISRAVTAPRERLIL